MILSFLLQRSEPVSGEGTSEREKGEGQVCFVNMA